MAISGVGVRELPEAHTFDFIGSGQGPVRDFGTERALVEPLGPNTGNFPNLSPHYSGLMWCGCGLIACGPHVRFHWVCVCVFIGSGPGPVRDFGTERALVEPLGPNTGNFPSSSRQNGH